MKSSWYREPWAWLTFLLPVAAVIASFTTYFIANSEPDTLVVGDYYKKGKAINFELSKIRLAQKLGMRFSFQYQHNELIVKPTGIEKTFPLINLHFSHPTLAKKDFNVVLTPDGQGFFRHHFEKDISGKWKITLTSFENTWKIQDIVYLPQNEFVELIPDPTKAQ